MTDTTTSTATETTTGDSTTGSGTEATPSRNTGATDGSDRGPVRSVALVIARLLGDALILGLGVVLLSLLFLSTGWPRWAFYALLLLGSVLYVVVTPPWGRGA